MSANSNSVADPMAFSMNVNNRSVTSSLIVNNMSVASSVILNSTFVDSSYCTASSSLSKVKLESTSFSTSFLEAQSKLAAASKSSALNLVLLNVENGLSFDAGSPSSEDSESNANFSWSAELNAAANLLSVNNDLLGAGWLRVNKLSSDAHTLSSSDFVSQAESNSIELLLSDASSD